MHPDFQALRLKMVDGQLRTTDVTKHELLAAFLSVPREMFVGEEQRNLAYLDDDIQIAPGRFLMEPSPLAKLLQLAEIAASDNVLIVGSGTGYSAAIVANIAQQVIGVESESALLESAKSNLATLQISNVEFVAANLVDGAPARAPYDVILIEGAVSSVPASLIAQLNEGGRLVSVEGTGLTGVASRIVKRGTNMSPTRGFNLSVKPLPGFQKQSAFVF